MISLKNIEKNSVNRALLFLWSRSLSLLIKYDDGSSQNSGLVAFSVCCLPGMKRDFDE